MDSKTLKSASHKVYWKAFAKTPVGTGKPVRAEGELNGTEE